LCFIIFQASGDDREAENQLVMLLGVDAFAFIKVLRQYRQMSKFKVMTEIHFISYYIDLKFSYFAETF
jgi:hypothetical protein